MNKNSKNNYRFSGDFYKRKDNSLFSDDEMFGRKIADKEKFDNLLLEHIPMLIEGIEQGIKRGLDILKGESSFVVNWRNSISNTYAPRVYEELSKRFSENSSWLSGERFSVNISGYILLPKIITPERRNPSNVKTKTNSDIINQKSYVPGDSPIIYLCYELDSSKMHLVDIVAKYIVGDRVKWASSLYDLQSSYIFDSKNRINLDTLDENKKKTANVSIRGKKKGNTKD